MNPPMKQIEYTTEDDMEALGMYACRCVYPNIYSYTLLPF
jgi:hypothetical protein